MVIQIYLFYNVNKMVYVLGGAFFLANDLLLLLTVSLDPMVIYYEFRVGILPLTLQIN